MITRPITRSITRAITRSIAGVETIVFIELEAAASPYYSLSSDWVVTGDYSIEQYVYFTGDAIRLSGNLSNANNSALINADGSIDWKADLSSATASAAASTVPVNELSLIKVKRVGAVGTVHVNGTLALTATVPTGTLSVNTFGNQNGSVSGGLQAKPKLTDSSTPANSLAFTLGELTANYELPINNVFGSELIDWSDAGQSTQGAWTWDGVSKLTKLTSDSITYQFGGDDLVAGNIYEIAYAKSGHTAGNPSFTVNSNAGGFEDGLKQISLSDPSGTYSVIVIPTENGTLGITGTGAFLTLGDISIKQVTNALTYNNIATTQDVRDTYTLSSDRTQWVGALQTINIAAQA